MRRHLVAGTPWPNVRELLGRGCLLGIAITAEVLVRMEQLAFGMDEDVDGSSR